MNINSSPQDSPQDSLLQVSPEHIVPNPLQPRKHFDQKSLNELAQSIRTQGVLQPLVVRKHPELRNRYELVAGERRWRALKQIEVPQVPVLLRNVSDHEILENIQRENLTVIEEAQSYQDLLQIHGYTQEELAKRIGKDRSTIANMLRLLQLPSALKNDLETGRITSGHARSILSLQNEALQLEMRERLLRNSWSVRETERQVRMKLDYLEVFPKRPEKNYDVSDNSETKASSADTEIQLQHLEEQLQRRLGSKVEINFREGKGQIKIDYYSLDEFERIFELLISD
jgi:ParB family chromosome partitioning protein